jgi:hypothetical protein
MIDEKRLVEVIQKEIDSWFRLDKSTIVDGGEIYIMGNIDGMKYAIRRIKEMANEQD